MTSKIVQLLGKEYEEYDFEKFYRDYIKTQKYFRTKNVSVAFMMDVLNDNKNNCVSREYYWALSKKFSRVTIKLLKEGSITHYRGKGKKLYNVERKTLLANC